MCRGHCSDWPDHKPVPWHAVHNLPNVDERHCNAYEWHQKLYGTVTVRTVIGNFGWLSKRPGMDL